MKTAEQWVAERSFSLKGVTLEMIREIQDDARTPSPTEGSWTVGSIVIIPDDADEQVNEQVRLLNELTAAKAEIERLKKLYEQKPS